MLSLKDQVASQGAKQPKLQEGQPPAQSAPGRGGGSQVILAVKPKPAEPVLNEGHGDDGTNRR